MPNPPRKLAFILAATEHGTMIVSRLDYAIARENHVYGVGMQMLESGAYDVREVEQLKQLLVRRRTHFGDGVVLLDCGANIGVHTVESAKLMTGWGQTIAIEAQERVFYALCGNIAVNNCFNARAINAGIGSAEGRMRVPVPDYGRPGNLGGLELRRSDTTEYIGQPIDYSDAATVEIPSITVDGLGLSRLDVLKIDVEGMEPDVLAGSRQTIEACRPIISGEHFKTRWESLADPLTAHGYKLFKGTQNFLAVHESDPTCAEIRQG